MNRWSTIAALAVAAILVHGCAGGLSGDGGWTTLIDGDQGLANWNQVGDANWRAEGGAIVADKGKGGFLVSKDAYSDFEIRAEFWAESDTNSGVMIRCSDPTKPGAVNCYEVNIWDIRPDPTYATGAIVNVARVPVPIVYKAGGRWNTYEIYARGAQMTVKLNGVVTVSVQNGEHPSGPLRTPVRCRRQRCAGRSNQVAEGAN